MLRMETEIVFLIVFRICEPLGGALPERNCTYYCVSRQTEPTGYPTHAARIFSSSSLHLHTNVASQAVIGHPLPVLTWLAFRRDQQQIFQSTIRIFHGYEKRMHLVSIIAFPVVANLRSTEISNCRSRFPDS